MMAETARCFQDHDAAARVVASPDPREQKRLGRRAHNFDCVIWHRVQEYAVVAGTFARFAKNPAMKKHLLSTETKRLVEASYFNPVWGIDLLADKPEAQDPSRWHGKKLL